MAWSAWNPPPMEVAFITAAYLPSLYEDDRLAATGLVARGINVTPLIWDQATPESMSRFDAVVMRSPWDWYKHRDKFRAFLASLRQVTAPVFNSPDVLLGFADKRYLLELAARGVPVVPTFVLEQRELERIPQMMETHGWHEAVLKPAFSAGAYDTYRIPKHRAVEIVADAVSLDASERWLVQPYLPDILKGELSFVFFDGAFSHAVKKVPPAGDWRVQEIHGGLVEPIDVSPADIARASAMLAQAAPTALYARVDCLVVEGRLTLMELELVEPELFFRFEPQAAGRFADALVRQLRPRHSAFLSS